MAKKKYAKAEDEDFLGQPKDTGEDDEEDAGPMPGNAQARPRSAKSHNPIVQHLNETESTTRDSPYYDDSGKKPYNPDDLVQRRMDYSTYDRDMINDDQVSVCLELKKDLVLGSGFEFVCDDAEPEEQEEGEKESEDEPEEPAPPARGKKPYLSAAKKEPTSEEVVSPVKAQKALMKLIKCDLEVAFNEDIETDIEESFTEMLSAYEIGFSLTEKVWKKREDGSMTLKSLKTRHPSTWLIHQDEKGNVSKYEQRTPKGSVDVKADALIHYVNNPRYQNPYGRSDLRAAYDAWFIKREIIKFYAIFLEKAASPTPIAKYGTNAPPEAVTEIYNAIKKFQTKTALCIPKEMEVEFLEAKSNGEAYIKGINIFNMFIGRALMIPDLLGFQGSETSGGSYSLGKDQMLVLYKHILKRRTAFEKRVNMHLVKPFVLANYGLVDKYPKFRLKEISDEKATEYAKLWIEAIKGKFYEPSDEEINYFRKLIKFPTGPVERSAPTMVSPTLPDGTPNPAYDPDLEAAKTAKQREKQGLPPKEGDDAKDKGAFPPKKDAEEDSKEKKTFGMAYSEAPGEYDRKVDYKLLKSGLEQGLAKVMDEGKPLIQEIYDDLFLQIRTKKILAAQDLAKIDKLKVKKLPQLKVLLKRRFKDLYSDAGKQARGEIVKGAQKYAAPLPNEDFMDFLEEETFQYIGDFEYNVKKKVRLALAAAIKDGKALSEVIDILDDEGVKLSTESLERYARTKLTEVMNRSRKEAFEETGVVAAYQFSAIMDDRVSEICGGLHGAIFEKDDAPTPPLHFNCRSVLIPITKYEDYKVTKSVEGQNIDKFIDSNIGDGFSRQ